MPKKLVRRGRVRGYRPTRSQLEEMLELAQRDIGEDSVAHLIYSQGDEEIYPRGTLKKISPNHLDEIIKDADDPDELNNLDFSISQESPVRRVDLHIGPGDWTTYQVESDDQTWAFGRYHELTEKLLADRALYAKSRAQTPQVLQEGSDNKWRSAAWELTKDWRISLAGPGLFVLWIVPIAEASFIAVAIGQYYDPSGTSKRETEANKQGALDFLHWIDHHAVILLAFSLSYLIALIALQRWLRGSLKSRVILRKLSLFTQARFQGRNSDPIGLASFYVAFFTLIVAIIALLIQ